MKSSNDGPRNFAHHSGYYDWLPSIFVVTDPDLEFNKNLPLNFLEVFEHLSEKYERFKVGFALDNRMEERESSHLFRHLEDGFWNHVLENLETGDPVYSAPIDTTFCLINKKFHTDFFSGIRVAGNYTAIHLHWLR